MNFLRKFFKIIMARKSSIYSKVDFKTLKNEIFSTMKYLAAEKVDNLPAFSADRPVISVKRANVSLSLLPKSTAIPNCSVSPSCALANLPTFRKESLDKLKDLTILDTNGQEDTTSDGDIPEGSGEGSEGSGEPQEEND